MPRLTWSQINRPHLHKKRITVDQLLLYFALIYALLVFLLIIMSVIYAWPKQTEQNVTIIELPTNSSTVEIIKPEPKTKEKPKKTATVGVASWYDYTLQGIKWSETHLTCASRTLKRYTMARVTNLETGESVDCYVNDVITHPDRIIDLSSAAFVKIAPLSLGLVNVKVEQL